MIIKNSRKPARADGKARASSLATSASSVAWSRHGVKQTTSPVMKKSPIKKPIKAKPISGNVTRDWSFARGGAM